jgi:hypothetical protein
MHRCFNLVGHPAIRFVYEVEASRFEKGDGEKVVKAVFAGAHWQRPSPDPAKIDSPLLG